MHVIKINKMLSLTMQYFFKKKNLEETNIYKYLETLLKELNTHHSRCNTHRHKFLKQQFARVRHSHQRNLGGGEKGN